jgi:hypothetical protein
MTAAKNRPSHHHQFAKAPNSVRRQILTMMAVVLWCSTLSAQDAPPSPQPTAAEKKEPAPVDDAREKLKARQKRRVTIGLVVVTLVTASGAALLAFTVLGGIATRRGLRTPFTEDDRTQSTGASALDPNLNETPSDFDIAESPRQEESTDEESE